MYIRGALLMHSKIQIVFAHFFSAAACLFSIFVRIYCWIYPKYRLNVNDTV